MSAFGLLLLAGIVAIPIGWLASEFWNNRPLRITLGILAIISTAFCVCAVNHFLTDIGYNTYFGNATKDLIETSLAQAKDEHLDRVLQAWRDLNSQYHPTYENCAEYKELVEAATARMKGESTIEPRSASDANISAEKQSNEHGSTTSPSPSLEATKQP